MEIALNLKYPFLAFLAVTWLAAAPAIGAELVMFETAGCGWCRLWHSEIGPGYPKTAEGHYAPLIRHQLEDPRHGIVLRAPVISSPTFVLVDNGREIGRIIGYPGADFFYGLLDDLLARLPTWKALSKSGTSTNTTRERLTG